MTKLTKNYCSTLMKIQDIILYILLFMPKQLPLWTSVSHLMRCPSFMVTSILNMAKRLFLLLLIPYQKTQGLVCTIFTDSLRTFTGISLSLWTEAKKQISVLIAGSLNIVKQTLLFLLIPFNKIMVLGCTDVSDVSSLGILEIITITFGLFWKRLEPKLMTIAASLVTLTVGTLAKALADTKASKAAHAKEPNKLEDDANAECDELRQKHADEIRMVKAEYVELQMKYTDEIKEAKEECEKLEQQHAVELRKAKDELERLEQKHASEIRQSATEKHKLLRNLKTYEAKKRICVISTHLERLRLLSQALLDLVFTGDILDKVEIIPRKLAGSLSASEADFERANLVIAGAFPEGRNMLIANPPDSEPSQLGAIYKMAQELGLDFFIVYMEKQSPAKNELYSSSLQELFKSQTIVGELAKKGQFLSVKYKEKEEMVKFNKRQFDLLSKWITAYLSKLK